MKPFAAPLARMRRFSPRLLSTAIVFEIAGSAAILLFLPRFWFVGVILIGVAAMRLASLAERARVSADDSTARLYRVIQWAAQGTVVLAVAFLVLGLLAMVLGGGWT